MIVGASLTGLRAAEALRDEGFTGSLTIIGDEVHEPYDRPPLSKQVLKGWVPAGNTKLPRLRAVDADWRLGVAATGLDRDNREVLLANGDKVPYDRLLIATGVRSRAWFNPEEAKLKGLYTLRTSDDAAKIQAAFKARPKRVLIVGAGFIGSEIASVCRDLGLDVTVAERSSAPLVGPLGGVIGDIAAKMQRDAGVDLRTGVAVEALKGDADGHVRQAQLSDGTTLDVDVVVASLGSIRNIEWLEGAELASRFLGRGVRRRLPRVRHQRRGDRQHLRRRRHRAGAARALRVPVHGDRARGRRGARAPRPRRTTWSTSRRGGARTCRCRSSGPASSASTSRASACARSATRSSSPRDPSRTSGSPPPSARTAASSEPSPSTTASGWSTTRRLIEQSAPFPPPPPGYDVPANSEPMSARFPDPREPTGIPDVVLTGHDPTSRGAEFRPKSR